MYLALSINSIYYGIDITDRKVIPRSASVDISAK